MSGALGLCWWTLKGRGGIRGHGGHGCGEDNRVPLKPEAAASRSGALNRVRHEAGCRDGGFHGSKNLEGA